jgi:diguanylate cyclase (GGDEF)-like protein/PAS domain S-box-containing protein
MNAAPGSAPASQPLPWWRRVHRDLMPDYNRKATTYWWTVVLLGAAILIGSVISLAGEPRATWVQVLVGTAIAMLAGFFPVRIPRSKIVFAAGEIFMFLLLLIHGPGAAALAASAEAGVGAMRTSKRWTSRIASPAMAAVAMFSAGSIFDLVLSRATANAGLLIVAAMLFSLVFFVFNTLLVTALPRLKRNERMQWSDLFSLFGWIGVAYAGSAAVASLLYLTYLQSGVVVLAAMVPLLAMMLATLHYFFRQQEAAEEVRVASAEAAERERELAQRHVQELEASERRFHSAFTHASIGMALLDFDGRILQANHALRTLVGHRDDELVQQPFQDVVLPADRGKLDQQLGLVSGHEFEGFALEFRCVHRDGSPVWVAAHCSFFSEPGAGTPCLILQVQDITARRNAEQGLHHLAFHDSLTGLPNRRRFHELLGQAVDQLNASKAAHDAYAVMFLDFDRFKLINDSLGHSAGDEFLAQVAQRIRHSIRPHDIVARLGGDEFGILARHVDHEGSVVGLADRLMEALCRPFVVAGTELTTSASIGITFSALGYTSAEDVLRDADTAMYKAKGAGKARYALFDASLHTEVAQRLRLEGDLRRAIDDGRLSVAYQPVWELVGAEPGRLAGFEALVRWQHPLDGSISPGAFLPIAEEAGLMLKLTDFVLHCACRQLRQWQQTDAAWAGLTMNVNVSGHDLSHPAFVARVTRAIVESGVRPAQLCLELTENILMSRLEAALPMLTELRQMGVTLAIDDFGTGYSSLSHLSTLPIDCLKIDRSFVARMEAGSNEAAVVRSIVALGSSLGKTVVAEGIETDLQLKQLQEMGCGLGQGYLLARPKTAEEVSSLLFGLLPDVPLAGAAWKPTQSALILH